jgi:ABC-type transporter Mla MlaB component
LQSPATLTIHAPLARSDLPGLIERARALLEHVELGVLRCDLSDVAADAVALDALARLALLAKREGCTLQLCAISPQLRALVMLAGLAPVLLCE